MISNVKKGTTCQSLSWSEFKRIIIEVQIIYLIKIVAFFVVLVSLAAIMSKNFLVQLRRCSRSSKFLLREHVFKYGIRKAVYFCDVFECYAFHQCHNI